MFGKQKRNAKQIKEHSRFFLVIIIYWVDNKIAANGQGFLLCWYSVIRQPELLLIKVNTVDVIFCCSALFVQPGLQLISEWDDEYIFFSQHSRKPNVEPNTFGEGLRRW